MTSRPSLSAPSKRRRVSSNRVPHAPLDDFARQTIELFTKVMIRSGYSRAAIAGTVRAVAGSIPPSVKAAASGSRPDFNDAGHVLTLWEKDPEYLAPNGTPRPIPARGPAPSIEALVARVSARLTFEEAWEQFERTLTLQRVGRLYVPRREAIIYLGDPALLAANTLRVLNACLQNLEHNATDGLKDPWYLRTAQHAQFPRSEVQAYLHQSVDRAMAFLRGEDSALLRTAKTAQPPRQRGHKQPGQQGRLSINTFVTFLPGEDIPSSEQKGHPREIGQRPRGPEVRQAPRRLKRSP